MFSVWDVTQAGDRHQEHGHVRLAWALFTSALQPKLLMEPPGSIKNTSTLCYSGKMNETIMEAHGPHYSQ